MAYCSLFGSNYLDKGLAMIDSLRMFDPQSAIYILCMDDLTHDVLKSTYSYRINLIRLKDFEDDTLLRVKKWRSFGEYCWTCTAKLLKFILDKYEEICTYVDSDLFFYQDPTCLIEEMKRNNCVVQIVPHRFLNDRRGRKLSKESGKNCVQFNTFTKDARSIWLLERWLNQCLDDCSLDNGGDQKYLDDWDKYDFVNVSSNGGAGVAPWNINRYSSKKLPRGTIYDKEEKKTYELVFYHFQNVTNVDDKHVLVLPLLEYGIIDKQLVNSLYSDYICRLEKYKSYIFKNFGYKPMLTKYISDRTGEERLFKRAFRVMISNPCEAVRKIMYRIRSKTRRKMAYFDVSKMEECKNDSLQ